MLDFFFRSQREALVLSGPAQPIYQSLFLDPCRPWYVATGLFGQKTKNIPYFQSIHFTRKYPRNLLRLKPEIVNTMKFRLVLGLIWG